MFAVIMAGGSGTRFWPASRPHMPKQFLKITSDRTMLEETMARVALFTTLERTSVVVGQIHTDITAQLLAGTPVQAIIEPTGRNTSACIGLAALLLKQRDAKAAMAVLPADAFIADVNAFAASMKAAGEIALNGSIVTLGIQPNRPETGYGYLQAGEEQGAAQGQTYFKVARFVEKPDGPTAIKYLASRDYFWNSGIFMFTVETILNEIAAHLPELYAGLCEIEKAIGTADYDAVLNRVYPTLESISIDYGVMERTAQPIYMLKTNFGWSDVGSWQALYELRTDDYDANGNLLLGDAVTVDARNNLVYATTGRKIALLGVENLAVVDTPDALLIAPIDRSQDVKKISEAVRGA
jgi:mannose-1-phosphate guanylyltransferase